MTSKQKFILVVDDDVEILKHVSKILKGAGYLVHVTQDPIKGREILETEVPHLIISDLNMEPEDGYSSISSVRRLKGFVNTPIIVLSAVNQFDDVKKAMTLGISDYVIKPLQGPLLLRKLAKALSNHEFTSWKASEDLQTELSVKISADITAISEIGYKITGPFKLSTGVQVKVLSQDFEKGDLGRLTQRTTGIQRVKLEDSNFINEMTFISADDEARRQLKQIIKKVQSP